MIIDIIGILAGTLTTIEVVPQVLKVLKTKSAGDLSWLSIIAVMVGCTLWVIYGIMRLDIWIVLPSFVTVVIYGILVVHKRYYDALKKYSRRIL